MLDIFHITLEARNPERDCFRSYRIEAGKDLFGMWLVEASFGRIGQPGQIIRFSSPDEDTARRKVQSILKQRSTAIRRIGVAYLTQKCHDPAGWLSCDTPGSQT
ncbi:MAG: WGR domain-containing protein [Fimbriiglobus sp.]